MEDPTKLIVSHVRVIMNKLAGGIDKLFKGKLKPSHVTTISLLGHFPAAVALYNNRPLLAAGLIAGFGLLDALDGALAREQGTVSKLGMFYDAVTDRMKEIIVYTALAIFVTRYLSSVEPWMVVAVAGSSLLVSYVKAKGEMAVTASKHDKQLLNRAFGNGISRYEIRMFLLILGLLFTDYLDSVLSVMLALNLMTAATRFIEIAHILSVEDASAKGKDAKN